MQSVGSSLPEFDFPGHNPIATPERWQGHFFFSELPFYFVEFHLEQCAG